MLSRLIANLFLMCPTVERHPPAKNHHGIRGPAAYYPFSNFCGPFIPPKLMDYYSAAWAILSIHPGCIKLSAVGQVWGLSNVANLLMQNKGEAVLSCTPEERGGPGENDKIFLKATLTRNNRWRSFRYWLDKQRELETPPAMPLAQLPPIGPFIDPELLIHSTQPETNIPPHV